MKRPDTGTRHDLIEHRFQIAKEDLETADLLLNAGQYRAANNRAYYSIFHTIDAVLSVESIAFKRHKDTLAYFNKQYVATGIFPRDMGRKIVKAEEIRHASDYDTFYVASKEITAQQVETAAQMLRLAREYYNEIISGKGQD